MGFLQALFGGIKRKPAAPFQVTRNIHPQENYAGYMSLPNLPMSLNNDDYNPYRLHAPFQVEREKDALITNAGVHKFDAGDVDTIRVPRQPLQAYFDQKKPLPPVVPMVPAHGVFVPTAPYKPGWRQSFVPEFGRRQEISGVTPVTLLSTPINVYTNQAMEGKRAPLKGAKAHKPVKGVH